MDILRLERIKFERLTDIVKQIDHGSKLMELAVQNSREVVDLEEKLFAEAESNAIGIDSLCLNVREFNSLRRRGFNTVKQLLNLSHPSELLMMHGIGKVSAQRIIDRLHDKGYSHFSNGVKIEAINPNGTPW